MAPLHRIVRQVLPIQKGAAQTTGYPDFGMASRGRQA
jgi:hypothetical protein